MWSSTIDIFTKVDSFLQWAASSFQSSIALINHEQLNIFDKFGQVMLDNLSQRGCSLPGIEACRNKTSHIDRLLSAGTQWSKINNPVFNTFFNNKFIVVASAKVGQYQKFHFRMFWSTIIFWGEGTKNSYFKR